MKKHSKLKRFLLILSGLILWVLVWFHLNIHSLYYFLHSSRTDKGMIYRDIMSQMSWIAPGEANVSGYYKKDNYTYAEDPLTFILYQDGELDPYFYRLDKAVHNDSKFTFNIAGEGLDVIYDLDIRGRLVRKYNLLTSMEEPISAEDHALVKKSLALITKGLIADAEAEAPLINLQWLYDLTYREPIGW